jgi:hypothetical protein
MRTMGTLMYTNMKNMIMTMCSNYYTSDMFVCDLLHKWTGVFYAHCGVCRYVDYVCVYVCEGM